MTDTPAADRAANRASHPLPEERAAGSADPHAQAAAILAESDSRESHPTGPTDPEIEHRTSAETADSG